MRDESQNKHGMSGARSLCAGIVEWGHDKSGGKLQVGKKFMFDILTCKIDNL